MLFLDELTEAEDFYFLHLNLWFGGQHAQMLVLVAQVEVEGAGTAYC
jgi:hypothetical protein